MAKERFLLTEWERQQGSGVVTRRLCECDHDGTELIVAEFDQQPAPLGELLARSALAVANAYAKANPDQFKRQEKAA
jgi:hypothetical protein